MAAPAIASALAKLGKGIAARMASRPFSRGEGEGSGHGGAVAAVLACALALSLTGTFLFISAPMQLWEIASKSTFGVVFPLKSSGAQYSDGSIGALSSVPDGNAVKWYRNEEKELRRWAEQQYGQNATYDLPDWRYLWAFDAAVSENDFSKVKKHAKYYRGLHKQLIEAEVYSWSTEEPAKEKDPGAYKGQDGNWYVTVEHTSWTVSCKSMKDAFSGSYRTVTKELVFPVIDNENDGDYGSNGWGGTYEAGRSGCCAIGFYQFDVQGDLPGLITYLVYKCPDKKYFQDFKPWANKSELPGGAPGDALETAWKKAYREHPKEFAKAQDDYWISTTYKEAMGYAKAGGLTNVEERRDCVKALICYVDNMAPAVCQWVCREAGFKNSMTDEQVIDAFVAAFCNHPPSNDYLYNYSGAIRAAGKKAKQYLKKPAETPPNSDEDGPGYVGSSPKKEGGMLSLEIKATLADNYQKAAQCIEVSEGLFGRTEVFFDSDAFMNAVLYGGSEDPEASSKRDQVLAAAEAVYKAKVPYASGGCSMSGMDCSGLVVWCYAKAGIDLPHFTDSIYVKAKELQSRGKARIVPISQAKPGDVLWADTSARGGIGTTGHVSIYAGNGMCYEELGPEGAPCFYHASSSAGKYQHALQFILGGDDDGMGAGTGFRYPLKSKAPVTSEYGSRWGDVHQGIDIGAASGTPILAAASGTVAEAEWQTGGGNVVAIDHGTVNGKKWYTRYLHQSKIVVKRGDKVSKGQVIGYVGNTGNSFGAHLHFETLVNGEHRNPREALKGMVSF